MITSVIVHRGKEFPPYIADFVDQFYLFNEGSPLLLVVDSSFEETEILAARHPGFQVVMADELPRSRNHRFFSRWNRMNASFRGGFWRFAVERFFILEDLMASRQLGPILHFEYDNLIYFEVQKLEQSFRTSSKGISLPADSIERCIPSVVYIENVAAMADFCDMYNRRYLIRKMTDMKSLSRYLEISSGRGSRLPVLPSWYKEGRTELRSSSGLTTRKLDLLDHDFELFGGIFDAAAFGQYLGGIDPRNDVVLGPGFVNETALYSPRDFSLRWERDGSNRLLPIAEYRGRSFPIFNLHIHSKDLARFRSDRSGTASA